LDVPYQILMFHNKHTTYSRTQSAEIKWQTFNDDRFNFPYP
jgi:hypothetical protein